MKLFFLSFQFFKTSDSFGQLNVKGNSAKDLKSKCIYKNINKGLNFKISFSLIMSTSNDIQYPLNLMLYRTLTYQVWKVKIKKLIWNKTDESGE